MTLGRALLTSQLQSGTSSRLCGARPLPGAVGDRGHGAEGRAECWSLAARSVQPTTVHSGSGAGPEPTLIRVAPNSCLSRLNIVLIVL